MVSALPRQEVGLREGALVAFVMNGLLSFLPHPLLEGLRVANGQVAVKEAVVVQGEDQGTFGRLPPQVDSPEAFLEAPEDQGLHQEAQGLARGPFL